MSTRLRGVRTKAKARPDMANVLVIYVKARTFKAKDKAKANVKKG